MHGTEKQENVRPTSVYLDDKHKRMANTLIKAGHYNNFSEMVRNMIEDDFSDKITDPKEELRKEKKRLEEIINELESIVSTTEDVITNIVRRYQERKDRLPAKALGNYEKYSKNWINQNSDEIAEAFPGKNVDEVYIELESRINKEG